MPRHTNKTEQQGARGGDLGGDYQHRIDCEKKITFKYKGGRRGRIGWRKSLQSKELHLRNL